MMRLENLVKARITLQNIHSVNKFYADFSNTLVSYLSKDHDILRKDLNRFKSPKINTLYNKSYLVKHIFKILMFSKFGISCFIS
jgi:hypothetical protein